MNTIAFIPARKNSKRLPGKNTKKLNGIPLIRYSIDFAKKLNFIDDIIISTDDNKIIEMYKNSKFVKVFKRPIHLSGDKSKTISTIIFTAKKYEKIYKKIQTIVLLQPTSPIRSKKSIVSAYKHYIKENRTKSVVSVSVANLNKKKMFILKNKKLELRSTNCNSKIAYQFDGNFYISNLNFLKKNKSFYVKNKTLAKNQKFKFLSVDIDTNKDFKLAEKYIKQQNKIT